VIGRESGQVHLRQTYPNPRHGEDHLARAPARDGTGHRGCYRACELRSRDPLSRRLVDGAGVATATMTLIGLPVRSPVVAM
jgi:hypothetical protein